MVRMFCIVPAVALVMTGCADPGDPTMVSTICPTDYVKVAANGTLGTSEFCAATYEMKLSFNDGTQVFDGTNGGVAVNPTLYKPESRANGVPWVRITHANASTECQSLGADYRLITAKEHQAIVRNVESTVVNWSGGSVGSGIINGGHSDSAVSGTAVADGLVVSGSSLLSAGNGTDSYAGTGQSSSDAMGSGGEQKRTWTLSNGEIIWDIAGNARDEVDADGLGGTVSYTGPASSNFYETDAAAFTSMAATLVSSNSVSLSASLFSPLTSGLQHATHCIGRYYILSGSNTGRVISRGGNFSSSNNPGIYAGDFDDGAASTGSSAGFRCTKTPE